MLLAVAHRLQVAALLPPGIDAIPSLHMTSTHTTARITLGVRPDMFCKSYRPAAALKILCGRLLRVLTHIIH